MQIKINWDGLGIATSIACAIHCIVLPLTITSLPLFGINIVNNVAFEWGMIFVAFAVGVYALWHGYKTHHKNKKPVILFVIGFVLLTAKQFLPHTIEHYLVLAAVPFIIAAHYINYKLCRKSKCASPHHTH
jgi:hydrogenase/urease accessory protein HupE